MHRLAGRTILSVAYPFAAVGPAAAGGAEQVLRTVEAALVREGLHSVVVAHEESLIAGRLERVAVPAGLLTPAVRAEVERSTQAAINRAFDRRRIDLVHMHGIDFHRYALPDAVPVVTTLHLPPAWYPENVWALSPRYRLHCVSSSQRAACPASVQKRITIVENGVELPPLHAPRRGRYALLLSRICPEKNLHTAMDAARAAGMAVLVAGRVYPYPEHLEYFEREIKPRLGCYSRFLGAVGGAAKQRLLERAQCLLMPSLAEETSSLVAMEAMAAGTPVVAFRSGALPEIVEDGKTGFLVNDAASMAQALSRLHELDRNACRRAAEERFSAEVMVGRYLDLYAECLA